MPFGTPGRSWFFSAPCRRTRSQRWMASIWAAAILKYMPKRCSDRRESAVPSGLPFGMACPTVAECGGFLYLQEQLQTEQEVPWPMVEVLPGMGYPTRQLRRFGYLTLQAERDSLLFRAGEEIPAHEFHHWDSTQTGTALLAQKPSGKHWRCGYATDTLYAAFPHLHFGGGLPLAERFVSAAAAYRERKQR